MKDPNRLEKIYKEIALLHKEYAPDMRIGQLFNNFEIWLMSYKGRDIFYIEDHDMELSLMEYFNSLKKPNIK